MCGLEFGLARNGDVDYEDQEDREGWCEVHYEGIQRIVYKRFEIIPILNPTILPILQTNQFLPSQGLNLLETAKHLQVACQPITIVLQLPQRELGDMPINQ